MTEINVKQNNALQIPLRISPSLARRRRRVRGNPVATVLRQRKVSSIMGAADADILLQQYNLPER